MKEEDPVVNNYYNANFKYKPQEELFWKYQIRDMLDEFIFVIAGILAFLWVFSLGKFWFYVAILGWTCC